MKYIVEFWEYERGWGSKFDSQKEFDTEEEARQHALDYNLKYNNATEVPDWYMKAIYTGLK